MDGQRFDALARVLAAPSNRRRVLGIWLGGTTIAVAAATRLRGDAAPRPQVCREEGQSCTLWVECCDGLFCDAPRGNPNDGICRTGQAPAAAPNQQPPAQAPKDRLPKTNTKGDRGAPPSGTPPANDSNTRRAKQPKIDKGKIKVTAACKANPNTLKVENTNQSAITITLIKAGGKEFDADHIGKILTDGILLAGAQVTFYFGNSATDRLSNQPFGNAGQTAKIEVTTNAGTLRASCKAPKEA